MSGSSRHHTPLRNLRLWKEEYWGILWFISEFLGRCKELGFQFSALSVRLWSNIPLFLYFPLFLLNKKRHKLAGWLALLFPSLLEYTASSIGPVNSFLPAQGKEPGVSLSWPEAAQFVPLEC